MTRWLDAVLASISLLGIAAHLVLRYGMAADTVRAGLPLQAVLIAWAWSYT